MVDYHLYFLRDNKLLGAEHIEAENDDEAARIATQRGTGDIVEVWNAQKRVRVIAPAKSGHVARVGTIAD
jgi:hypothetical protein